MRLCDAAKKVLAESRVPMTAREIWDKIVENGLDKQIDSKGKTPDATIGAWLYIESKKSGGAVSAVGSKPKKFVLSSAHTTTTPNSVDNRVVLKSPVHSIQQELPLSHVTSQSSVTRSIYYDRCFSFLAENSPRPMGVGEILRGVLSANPQLPWKKSNGAVRAALIRASKAGTPIRMIENSKPPLFYVGEGQSVSGVEPNFTPRFSFLQCAEKVLREFGAKRPMHYRDITAKALEKGWLETQGEHPEMTMNAQIGSDIRRRQLSRKGQMFVQHGRGYIGLREWMAKGLRFEAEQHNKRVCAELLKSLQRMKPEEFEVLVGRLLEAMDFIDTEVTKASGDGGIDVRGTWRIADGIQIKMAIQAKRWKQNVQAPVVQAVRGSLSSSERGMIITTSDFSSGARREADDPAKASTISLVNGEQLVNLLVKYGIGITRDQIEVLELDDKSGLIGHPKTNTEDN